MNNLEIFGFKGELSFKVKCPKCKKTVNLVLQDIDYYYLKCDCGCIFNVGLVVKIKNENK